MRGSRWSARSVSWASDLPDFDGAIAMTRNAATTVIALGLMLALATRPSSAQQLGTLAFPTSGSAAAQAHFITGMLFMHSFEYPAALKEFREAERLEPRFAMAYWGEAMTYTHPVWNQQTADSARAALRRLGPTPAARLARAPTEREKGYLRAVDVLYGEGSKAGRDTAYSAAMHRLAQSLPQDDEAQLFYALSLLGLNQGDRDVATYLRAGEIAQRIFARQPDHPGAAHYVIHAYDDPPHAQLGLVAARAYSKIAPDAAHAQHMTSHIFLALGMWDDVVAANEVAMRVVNDAAHHAGRGSRNCGHYAEWLEYGYLQQGRMRDAAKVLDACWGNPGAEGATANVEGIAGMRAAWIVDSREAKDRFTREPVAKLPGAIAYMAFGTGYAASVRGDRVTLANAYSATERAVAAMSADERAYGRILQLGLRALVLTAGGDSIKALESAREAARMDDSLPMPFGPPLTVKPPHELLGELLLAMQRPADARKEFELALARTPLRARAVLGVARAERALGHGVEAAAAYRRLHGIWRGADAQVAELAEVRDGAMEGRSR